MDTPDPGHRISPTLLPEVISNYLTAHRARDDGASIEAYTRDAIVVDEGNTYRGTDEIREWLQRSAGEYTYTTELIDAQRFDDEHYTATQRLEGNFPGGLVDLRFQFTLRDGRIAALTIEP